MTLRTKTARRLTLLACAMALVAITGFAYFVVHRRMQARLSSGFRSESIEALDHQQYYRALNAAASYLGRLPDKGSSDPEVQLVYARARAKVEEPDGSHLIDAIKFYQMYLEHRPEDATARRELLDMLVLAGRYPEARDLAPSLRPSDLNDCSSRDIPVLVAELKALYATKATDDRVAAILARIEQLDSLDIDSNIIRLDVAAQKGKRDEGVARAEKLLATHAEDPRAKMVLALAKLQVGRVEDVQGAARLFADAAGLDEAGRRVHPCALASGMDVRRLVESLDLLRLHGHALELLKERAEALGDTRLQRDLARRLWQEGQFDDLLARFGGLEASMGTSDSELLGFLAMAHLGKGERAPAHAIDEVLKQRQGDPRLNSWRTVIEMSDATSAPKPAEAIEPLRAAIRAYRGEPILHQMLGDTLASLGRFDDARTSWRGAIAARDNLGEVVAHGWTTPILRIAETLMNEGRAIDAAKASIEALQMAPAKLATNVLFLEAQTARLLVNSPDGPSPQDLLVRLTQVEEALKSLDAGVAGPFRDRLVPCRVALLARAGRVDEAKSYARERLSGSPRPSADAMRRIAAISASESLGLEKDALAQAETQYGETAEVLFARAVEKSDRGQMREGADLLRAAAKGNAKDPAYSIALARFLEGRDTPAAIAAWNDVLARFGSQVLVVRSVLASPCAAQDRALMDNAVRTFQALAGKEGADDPIVRIARARSLLASKPDRVDRDRAISLLTDVITAAPTLIEPRMLMASAFTMSDPQNGIDPDAGRAVEQLKAALVVDPRSTEVLLELGRLEMTRGNLDKSREALNRVAGDRAADAESRRRAAELLVAQGEFKPASEALQQIADAAGEATPVRVLLLQAECARADRDMGRAAALYDRVASKAKDLDSLFIAARFFSGRGDQARVDALLARMSALNDRPWVLMLARARLSADQGREQQAVSGFEQAAAESPGTAEIWRTYADFLVRRNQTDAAIAVAERGLKSVPGDAALVLIREQARMLQNPDADADLTPLIQALDQNAEQAGVREMLRAIQQARVRGELNTPERLSRLVQQYPSSVPLMMFVARKLEPLDPAQSLSLSQRAMQTAPADPAPARLRTELCMRAQRWQEMLKAALEWRQRDNSASAEPDLAIAEAQLNLNQPQNGIEAIQPHLARALEAPEEPVSLAVLSAQARLLVASGREPQARAFLRPLLGEMSPARSYLWLNVATRSLSSYDLAEQWVDELRKAVPRQKIDENLQIVSALAALAARFPDRAESISSDINALLKEMLEDPRTATAAVHEAAGIFRHRAGDVAGAKAEYERAVELEPSRPVALNNLADLALRDGRLDEALALAKRAVEAAPNQPGQLDTLGSVYAEMGAAKEHAGDLPQSKAMYGSAADAMRRLSTLTPSDHRPLIRFADYAARSGDDKAAEWGYERVLSMRSLPDAFAPALKNNMAQVLLRLSRNANDVARALLLASEAARAQNLPAIRDTLGWAQLASGQREQAISTFEGVIADMKDPPADAIGTLRSSQLGLARGLASGSEADRARARELIAGVPSTGLSAELATKLEAVKVALGK
jgi:tetratricopeptide (TPR) repeat protein